MNDVAKKFHLYLNLLNLFIFHKNQSKTKTKSFSQKLENGSTHLIFILFDQCWVGLKK